MSKTPRRGSKSALVCLSPLTRSERRVFVAWCERLAEVSQWEGRQLDYYTEGMPLLVCAILDLFPRMGRTRLMAIINRVTEFERQVRRTAQETGGAM